MPYSNLRISSTSTNGNESLSAFDTTSIFFSSIIEGTEGSDGIGVSELEEDDKVEEVGRLDDKGREMLSVL